MVSDDWAKQSAILHEYKLQTNSQWNSWKGIGRDWERRCERREGERVSESYGWQQIVRMRDANDDEDEDD